MGLYYTLSNGEEIEIDIQEDGNYSRNLLVKLFNGGTTLEYNLQGNVTLNNVILYVEENYNELLEESQAFERTCWCN